VDITGVFVVWFSPTESASTSLDTLKALHSRSSKRSGMKCMLRGFRMVYLEMLGVWGSDWHPHETARSFLDTLEA
jgi:hypothetical protein